MMLLQQWVPFQSVLINLFHVQRFHHLYFIDCMLLCMRMHSYPEPINSTAERQRLQQLVDKLETVLKQNNLEHIAFKTSANISLDATVRSV
jgi:hypothetical protein